MAIVRPDYKLICAYIGGYGTNSDGGIFEQSVMGRRFKGGMLNVPDKPLTGQDEKTPHVLTGDETFPLKHYLMWPYPYRQAKVDERKGNCNYRLCCARRFVQNVFGILVQNWRLYYIPLEMNVETVESVVKVTCVLHNYFRTKSCDSKCYEYMLHSETVWVL